MRLLLESQKGGGKIKFEVKIEEEEEEENSSGTMLLMKSLWEYTTLPFILYALAVLYRTGFFGIMAEEKRVLL